MLKKLIKDVVVFFKLLFITTKNTQEEPKSSNSEVSVIPDTGILNITNGIEQQTQMFQRQNDLIREGTWDEPIVYESDMITIKKENQYDYLKDLTPEEKELEEQELLTDDISLMKGVGIFTIENAEEDTKQIKISTVDYLTQQQLFDEKWERIEQQARDEDSDVDGIIKE